MSYKSSEASPATADESKTTPVPDDKLKEVSSTSFKGMDMDTAFEEIRFELESFSVKIATEFESFEKELERLKHVDKSMASKDDIIREKLEAWALDSENRTRIEKFAKDPLLDSSGKRGSYSSPTAK